MVNNHYRWDFIGLSTDDKPTSETSEKVVNGSTFYCSDTSKLYVYCDGTWYERKPLGEGGGGGGTSDFDDLDNRPKYNNTTMSSSTNIPLVPTKTSDLDNDSGFITSSSLPTVNDATLTITQNGTSVGTFTANDSDDTTIALTDTTYTAGSNVQISANNEISATDTTYSAFTGTDGSSAGAAGLVPAPATTDAGKFLKADGTWDTAGGSITPVQTTGTSTTDVMSQNATTSTIFADPSTGKKVRLGNTVNMTTATDSIAIGTGVSGIGLYSTAIGPYSAAIGAQSVAIGQGANANKVGSVALGDNAIVNYAGEVAIGTSYTGTGYNNSNYRLLTGVYDGQNAHDAATVGQVNAVIDAINTALSTNIPHIGA